MPTCSRKSGTDNAVTISGVTTADGSALFQNNTGTNNTITGSAINVATGALSAITGLAYGPLYRLPEIEACGVAAVADRLNYLQFLTIRSYLSLVFAALVLLLLVLAIWP